MPPPDIHLLNRDEELRKAYDETVSSALQDTDPETLSSEELAAKARTVMTEIASNVIPAKQKTKFPPEFTEVTISLLHQKRHLWRHM